MLAETAISSDLYIISSSLPPLPAIGIALEFGEARPSAAARALGEHIRAVLPGL